MEGYIVPALVLYFLVGFLLATFELTDNAAIGFVEELVTDIRERNRRWERWMMMAVYSLLMAGGIVVYIAIWPVIVGFRVFNKAYRVRR